MLLANWLPEAPVSHREPIIPQIVEAVHSAAATGRSKERYPAARTDLVRQDLVVAMLTTDQQA